MPLYDIFGSTIELVDANNPGSPVTMYYYDPYGVVTTSNNNQRSPWPFLYHGLEQEYPDSWKLYWEPGGNVYNPDPFQLSLTGPQGLGGGGGAAPRSIGFGSPHAAVNWVGISLEVAQNIAGVLDPDVISIGSDPPLNIVSPYDPFNLLAGLFQGGIPSIPWYDTTHKSRGAHDVYCRVQGICGAIVTQHGHITLAQVDDDEDFSNSEWDPENPESPLASLQSSSPRHLSGPGLPPEGIVPPAPNPNELKVDAASRSSERAKGGLSLWDTEGGEWRYASADKWRNPHWDYNPWNQGPNTPWQNIPIGNLPPHK